MYLFNLSQNTVKSLNALSCLAVCFILAMALFMQFYWHELPCPLCLLQRIGFVGIAFGFLLNAYDHPRQFHYIISILSAIFTIAVGLRQTLLHIIPNTGVYGSPIFGLHLYTWSVVIGASFILWIVFLLMNDKQFNAGVYRSPKKNDFYYRLLFLLLIVLVVINAIVTFGICGMSVCPSDPTHYLWQK